MKRFALLLSVLMAALAPPTLAHLKETEIDIINRSATQ
jgi:hypothetical protein